MTIFYVLTSISVFIFLKTRFLPDFQSPEVEHRYQNDPRLVFYSPTKDAFLVKIPYGNLFAVSEARGTCPVLRTLPYTGLISDERKEILKNRRVLPLEDDSDDNTLDIQRRIRGDSLFSEISQHSINSAQNGEFENVGNSIDEHRNNLSQNSQLSTPNQSQQLSLNASEVFGVHTPSAQSSAIEWSVLNDTDTDSNHAVDLVGRLANQRANRVMNTPSTEVLLKI